MAKIWRKMNGTQIKIPLLEGVEKILENELAKGNELKVCIGTDSQVYGSRTDFATAIVFVRQKRGGFMLVNKEFSMQKRTIKERMMDEVARSIQVAYELCDLLSLYEIEMEVHADINTSPLFKSNAALSEAMGYIKGMGFTFRAKPNAFASSTCANKMC